MPRIGILDSLEQEQKDQLVTWIETYNIGQVLEKVAAPPPDGFGIKTHITSLRRFYQREKLRDGRDNVALARSGVLHPEELSIIQTAALTAVTQRALESAIAPDFEGSHLPAAAKWLLALQETEMRRQQLNLRQDQLQLQRERLELEKARLVLDAEFKAIGMLYPAGAATLGDIARDLLSMDKKHHQNTKNSA
jgi:hypothetical protein